MQFTGSTTFGVRGRIRDRHSDPERSVGLEAAAHEVLVGCVTRFFPWCEAVADDALILDVSGLSKLLGTPAHIARGIREEARALSLYI